MSSSSRRYRYYLRSVLLQLYFLMSHRCWYQAHYIQCVSSRQMKSNNIAKSSRSRGMLGWATFASCRVLVTLWGQASYRWLRLLWCSPGFMLNNLALSLSRPTRSKAYWAKVAEMLIFQSAPLIWWAVLLFRRHLPRIYGHVIKIERAREISDFIGRSSSHKSALYLILTAYSVLSADVDIYARLSRHYIHRIAWHFVELKWRCFGDRRHVLAYSLIVRILMATPLAWL